MSLVPYSSAVGSLMYAMVCTRPDLAHAVSVVSRYMHSPGRMHWEAVKCILRYLKGTSNIGLSFEKSHASPNGIVGYVDSDYAGDLDARKSLSSYIFFTLWFCYQLVFVFTSYHSFVNHRGEIYFFYRRSEGGYMASRNGK